MPASRVVLFVAYLLAAFATPGDSITLCFGPAPIDFDEHSGDPNLGVDPPVVGRACLLRAARRMPRPRFASLCALAPRPAVEPCRSWRRASRSARAACVVELVPASSQRSRDGPA